MGIWKSRDAGCPVVVSSVLCYVREGDCHGCGENLPGSDAGKTMNDP